MIAAASALVMMRRTPEWRAFRNPRIVIRVVARGGAYGVHNPKYIGQILYDSYFALTGLKHSLRTWRRKQRTWFLRASLCVWNWTRVIR